MRGDSKNNDNNNKSKIYGALDGDQCCRGQALSEERDVGFAILCRVVKERLTEKVTFEGSDPCSYIKLLIKLGGENSKWKEM